MWAWSCDGCTAWSETLWRRVQPGSPGMTGGRPPGEAGNLCTLQEKGMESVNEEGEEVGRLNRSCCGGDITTMFLKSNERQDVSSTAQYCGTHTAGSGTRPPAVGCCPACSRSISPAGGRRGCVRGRRESDTESSAPWTLCPMLSFQPLCTPPEGWSGHWDQDTRLMC